ncbi:hypothetical protein [Methylocystis heyeri]|uniref:Yip1 domain-containing protein n=1 Tax=Methylocystis heyeri TaxID=391905 RepID=A0A6B8KJU2_9HYPH|nr:hypothetical protein [Methylocystis heyeri]QGM46853.1 hypothetical protein H2LOC_014760 [Methylocystis heyeri]
MAIKLPGSWAESTPKALYDIIALEGGQKKLPASVPLMGGFLLAYVVAQALVHSVHDHGVIGSLGFGIGSAALVGGLTAGALVSYKRRELIVQTVTALAATGVAIAISSILLHFLFAVALPPPLPTQRLVGFLLFPIAIWNVFAFAWIYRHAAIRTIPAFAFAVAIVIIIYFIMATLIH